MSAAQPPADVDLQALREYYQGELAKGLDRFLEPRAERCPWCGSTRLKHRVRGKDLWQGKPGMFDVDECRSCGYVFQNPRLTSEGLDFYYRDFYDGLGQGVIDTIFGGAAVHNHDRARMVQRELAKTGGAPERWLDVGTGYGHFARDAREVLPDTTFDGLDMGVAVTLGVERGWLDHAHQGMLPDLAPSLAGQYDVLSMHHYLEHTLDPRAELDAAATVLPPGGVLLIEVPNPDYWVGKLLGRWWFNLLQPQHVNLIPMANLVQALVERGFTIAATSSGDAHMSVDASFALPLLLDSGAAFPKMFDADAGRGPAPWLPEDFRPTRRGRPGRLWSKLVLKAGHVIDKGLAPLARRTDNGNAYRVLARRDPV
jgi:ubiquinone/menaquinone biosynthesis C-methylase UbiE